MKKVMGSFILILLLVNPLWAADVKISDLPAATSIIAADVLPVVASGVTKKITAANLGVPGTAGTTGQILTGVTGAIPAWSGGTMTNTKYCVYTAGVGIVCNSEGGSGAVATDTIWDAAGDLVQGTGANTAAKIIKGAEGTILRAGATSNAYSTSTFADTYGIGTLLHASAANTVTGLANGTTGQLLTAVTGAAPAWAAALTGSFTFGNGVTPGSVYFLEGTGGGTNTVQLIGPASTADVVVTLPAATGTVALTSDITASSLNFVTSGTIQGGIVINSDADGMIASAMTAVGVRGTLFIATGAGTWILPTAAGGESLCLMDSGTAHDLILDVTVGDTMRLKGTEQADGVGITNASGATTGDFICVVAVAANKWSTLGMQGTWASQ